MSSTGEQGLQLSKGMKTSELERLCLKKRADLSSKTFP